MEPQAAGDYRPAGSQVASPVKTQTKARQGEAKTKVLVVDDSAIVRKVLSEILGQHPDLEVVGTAPDPYIARDKIVALRPDVLTLDIEMPRMDGLTFLEKLMRHYPLPVIVISSLTQSSTHAAMEALSRGAVDVLAKPGGPYSVGDLREDLPRRIRAAAWAGSRLRQERNRALTAEHVSTPVAAPAAPAAAVKEHAIVAAACREHQVVAIGASTGGTQAIEAVLGKLPREMPPIVVTQHIPAGFSRAFAERLNRVCVLEVSEASGGETLTPGHAYIARGDQHMVIERSGAGSWRIRLDGGPKVCYQRPSVDVMFESVAVAAGSQSCAVLLTGMGSDGSHGMLAMKNAGARTVAESEKTCVVFGMPREAIRLGAAERVMDLDEIAGFLIQSTRVTARS